MAELGLIEHLAHQIQELTVILHSSLPPEQFTLVWQLRHAVEGLALAEEILRERRLLDSLPRHLPACAAALRATRQHLVDMGLIAEEPA